MSALLRKDAAESWTQLQKANALIEALAAQIAALTAERNALRALCKRMHDEFVDVDFSAWPEMQGAQAEVMVEYAARASLNPTTTRSQP